MILSAVHAIVGILFALFIPGFILTLIIFNNKSWLEKLAFSIAFSIIITVIIGISLGYNEGVKNITGGINAPNVWIGEIAVTLMLTAIYLMRKKII